VRRFRLNISYKITLIFCAILAFVFLGVFAYLDTILKDFVYHRVRAALLKETLLVKMFLEKDFPGYPRLKEIDSVVDRAGHTLGSRVTLIGLDGTVIGDSGVGAAGLHELDNHLYRPEVQEALRSGKGESVRFSTTVRKNMLYLAITFGKEKAEGIVRLSLPLSDVDEISGRLKTVLLISLGGAFVLIAIGSLLASMLITRSIKEMSTVARNVARGDFSKKALIVSNDEMGDLADAFNYMTGQISLKIEEVVSNKKRLEAVLLSMFEGVMVVDAKGGILLINKSLKDFLKVEQDPAGKKPIEVLRNVELQEITDKVLALKTGLESREISVLMPEERTLLVHGTPIRRDDKTEGAVLVFSDISDLRRLEKIRKDFVANVSHELRTPASNIKGFTETLLDGALEDKEHAEEFVRIIQANSDRLINLVEDLLDLSRLESGKMPLVLDPCPLRHVSERVIGELSVRAAEKGIDIRNDIPAQMAMAMADASRIAQVFFNLLDNAIKYTERKGTVILSAREEKDMIKVEIKDNGPGIPEKDLLRIFERFYCVDKGRSRSMGGTGLGLSIVKHIVHDHGGDISARSAVGEGSTFIFTLRKA
jgi:two-component system, OmpR family, phosphate regulon sensor histidine kinase PhoR